MMKIPNKYLSYLWTLITIILSMAIIFASTLLPASMLNISALPDNFSKPISLDLPDIFEIETKPSQDNDEHLIYFPQHDSAYNLSTEFYIEEATEGEAPGEISQFSVLVTDAISMLFEVYTDSDYLSQKCVAWNVYSKSDRQFIDIIVSVNIILYDSYGTLWTITAYGDTFKITYLNRSPYFLQTDSEKESYPSNTEYAHSITSKDVLATVHSFIRGSLLFGFPYEIVKVREYEMESDVKFISYTDNCYLYRVVLNKTYLEMAFEFDIYINMNTQNIDTVKRVLTT